MVTIAEIVPTIDNNDTENKKLSSNNVFSFQSPTNKR